MRLRVPCSVYCFAFPYVRRFYRIRKGALCFLPLLTSPEQGVLEKKPMKTGFRLHCKKRKENMWNSMKCSKKLQRSSRCVAFYWRRISTFIRASTNEFIIGSHHRHPRFRSLEVLMILDEHVERVGQGSHKRLVGLWQTSDLSYSQKDI